MKAAAKPAANVHFRKDGIGVFSDKPVTPVAPPVTLPGYLASPFWPAEPKSMAASGQTPAGNPQPNVTLAKAV
jgi:hypothetical protein